MSFLSACATLGKSDTSAISNLSNTEKASYYEKLLIASPNDGENALALSETYFRIAEENYKKAEANAKENLRSSIALYQNTITNADKSLSTLRAFLSLPDEGPGMMDKMKKALDAKYQTLRERQVLQNKASLKLKAQISSDQIQALENELTRVLSETARLLDLNQKNPDSAYDDFVPYFAYAPFITEVNAAKLEIEKLSIHQLDKTAYAQLEKKRYTDTEKTLSRLSTISGGDAPAKAGLLSIASHKSFLAKDYSDSFMKLLDIRSIYPESEFSKNYFEKTKKLFISTQFSKVDALIKAGKLSGFINAFEFLDKLSKAVEGDSEIQANIDTRNSKLRSLVSSSFIKRAQELKKTDQSFYSSLILRNLRLARQFDPEQLVNLEEEASKALAITNRKNEMKVLVNFVGSEGQSQEWSNRLESDLFAELESSGIPGVTIVDKNSVKGQENKLGIVDLAIKGNLDTVSFSETGRDTPRRRSSKYISGTRQIDNPAYPIAKEKYERALSTYRTLKSQMDDLKRRCRELDGFIAQMACQAGVSYISSADKDNAYAKLQATPQELTKNIISSYQYDHYVVKHTGTVHGGCVLVDNMNRSEAKCTVVNEKLKSEGEIIANAKPSDTEGIKDSVTVPDLINEQEAIYDKVKQSIASELKTLVDNQRTGRFCNLADSIKSPANKLKALESYSMCKFLLVEDQDKRQEKVASVLNEYLEITPEQAQRFGAPSNGAESVWPAPSDAEDEEMKVVMMKFGSMK